MARLQILMLPPYGCDGESPFALIVDQCETPDPILTVDPTVGLEEIRSFGAATAVNAPPVEFTDGWQKFGKDIGARSVLVSNERVDIAGEESGDNLLVEFDTAALAQSFTAAMRSHLESSEASDAVRAWYERNADRAQVGRER